MGLESPLMQFKGSSTITEYALTRLDTLIERVFEADDKDFSSH